MTHDSSAPEAHRRKTAPLWSLPAAVLAGVGGAVQAQLNGRLAVEIGDGFVSAVLSFTIGLLLATVLVASSPSLRRKAGELARDVRGGRFPWFYLLGGLGGALLVLGQTLAVPLIGVALFIICLVGGQTAAGLVVDKAGISPGGPRPLSANRLVGAGLMIAAVALSMTGGLRADVTWLLLALPLIAGIATSFQQAFNGRITAWSGHYLIATLVNFLGGTALLAVVAAAHVLIVGPPAGALPANPLLYLGGPIGVAYIALAAHLAEPLGVLTLAMAMIAGQIVGSVALDAFAPTSAGHLGLPTVAGAALTLVAALVTAGRRR
ncbi:DMT family transporter [Nigerium massiliense]|uniref:DMT family transporter n=1 Tax=Nigerium massiliense TaxID=1522317 RepID=UPI000590401D|nr:DMT family transporter [Nigerium massiliense]